MFKLYYVRVLTLFFQIVMMMFVIIMMICVITLMVGDRSQMFILVIYRYTIHAESKPTHRQVNYSMTS